MLQIKWENTQWWRNKTSHLSRWPGKRWSTNHICIDERQNNFPRPQQRMGHLEKTCFANHWRELNRRKALNLARAGFDAYLWPCCSLMHEAALPPALMTQTISDTALKVGESNNLDIMSNPPHTHTHSNPPSQHHQPWHFPWWAGNYCGAHTSGDWRNVKILWSAHLSGDLRRQCIC